MRILIALLFILSIKNAHSQIVFEQRFNNIEFPANWIFSSKTELGLWLGQENSNYVRFHPNFQNQSITSPAFNVSNGNYILYFDWNKAGILTIDSVQVQLSIDNGSNWQTVYAIYNGNNRSWQTDSILLNNLSGSIKLKWNYFSSNSFPSQYFNLDNVVIKNAITTSLLNKNYLQASVFPNPSNGVFQLKLFNLKNNSGRLFIYNTAGDLVYQHNLPVVSQSLIQVDLSSLSKGTYILNIQTGDQTYSSTLFIQ